MEQDKDYILPFEPSNWEKWKRSIMIFILSQNITKDTQKQAIILHRGGQELQDIFFGIPEHGNPPDGTTVFQHTINLLDQHFIPKVNPVFERHVFRKIRQEVNESVGQFISKLRQQVAKCGFADADTEMCDQIIEHCTSDELRRKLLEKNNLSLSEIIEEAKRFELVVQQADTLGKNGKEMVNKVTKYEKKKQYKMEKLKTRSKACYRCGNENHLKNDPSCPAKDKKCGRCGLIGHFKAYCRTKLPANTKEPGKRYSQQMSRSNKINAVEEAKSDDEAIVFQISKKKDLVTNLVICKVGGTDVKFLIDSGSSCNIVSEQTWKRNKINYEKKESEVSQKLYAYSSKKPLEVIEKVRTTIKVSDREEIVDIFVVKGNNQSLLGYETSVKLGLLKIGLNINEITSKTFQYKSKYPNLFNGIGKLKGKQVQLHINEVIKPVAQQHRRIPIHLRNQLENELLRLEKLDIIEKVDGPTPWVSPIVLVPKKNGEVRLCVDMRRPNAAIERVRHVTPTIDDIISAVNGSKVFSKLDLNEGYHQLELECASRSITTFSTHVGLRRYKRLNFGINSAAEVFQDEIRQVLVNIPNVMNVSDDILIYAKSQDEHDNILEKVLSRLQEKGLTLNYEKCLFSVKKLTFFGYQFSEQGVEIDKKKIEAFIQLKPPSNVSEVRSVLGMINYCGRFIPNLAEKTKPLRNLITANRKWSWSTTEQTAFEELKESIVKNVSNAYYDIHKQTELIVDAGPEGIAAILAQSPNKIIACASKALNQVEKRYSQIEKEMLAAVWAVQHFKLYLLGSNFILKTDNKPLVSILSSQTKETSVRLERFRLKLQGYNFKVVHTKGNTNPSDFMSRHPIINNMKNNDWDSEVEEHVNTIAELAIPKTMTRKEVAEHSNNDEEITKAKKALLEKTLLESEYRPFKDELAITSDGLLLKQNKIVIPKTLRKKVVKLAHTGHQGIEKTKSLLRSKVWFPNMNKMVTAETNTCIPCQAATPKTSTNPIMSSELPPGPWENLDLDFGGPFPNGKYTLVIIDEYSRYPIVRIINNLKTETVVYELKKMFMEFGLPECIKTDNGPPMNGTLFSQFLNSFGIKHRKVMPCWPQANGTVERFMRTLGKAIKTSIISQKKWEEAIDEFLMSYRTTPHTTTKATPASLMFRGKFRTWLPEMKNIETNDDDEETDTRIRQNDTRNKNISATNSDARHAATEHELEVGDTVLVKQKEINKYSTPFNPEPLEIIEVKGTMITGRRDDQGQVTRNASHFKKITTEEPRRGERLKRTPKHFEDYTV
ncbi:unnamed protein product [Macrosiphum euphorbiae]|uniref:RNA-directed DNA polymerase n=1 Tax=Macrosiphum euphorbiae TaxID=13131 RepID=A0AAV0XH84_9HEMI|nr:unnamed protein product [Macrosiphum euphorbiae]